MEGQYAESGQQTKQRAEEFLIKEGILIFWGMTLLAVMLVSLAVYQSLEPSSLIFERNAFGEGEKEVSLILQSEEQRKEYSLTLGERSLSREEEDALKEEFFGELEEQMAGENTSLHSVDQELCFEDALPSWPFTITYEPKDTACVRLDGSLGERGANLTEGGEVTTKIAVTAEYGDYVWKKDFVIRLVPEKKKGQESPFARIVRQLRQAEKETRDESSYVISPQNGDVQIRRPQRVSPSTLCLLGSVVILLLLLRNVSELNNGEKACRKESLRDFPVIVHLLTLYMGAGLSFPSAVHRISTDYQSRADGRKTYAFEEILRMDTRLRLGEAQQEACMQWGRRFKEPVYQKLALTLLQVMAKGTREGRALMSQMEQESFRQRLDQAKTEGEEAATKLLFPMIVLLGMVMILVMFPAIARFQGF